jgi:hypothetical protein
LCNRSAEGVWLDVIREPAPAVDLHDRQPLAVLRLERLVAGDVHLPQVEAELLLELGDDATGSLTQVAARGVIHDDVGYG